MNAPDTEVIAESAGVLRRVWRGTGMLVAGRVYGVVCTLTTFGLLAAALPEGEFGRYTYYLAVFALLDSMVDFGTGAAAVQRTSEQPESIGAVLRTARRLRTIAAMIGVLLVGGGAFFFDEPGAAWILLASLYPLTHPLELSATVFKNRISLGLPVIARAVGNTASLVIVVLLLHFGVRDPAPILTGVALGSTFGNLGQHFAARNHLPRERSDPAPLRAFLRLSLPLGLAALCQQAYFYVDNLFIRPIAGDASTGHYNLAVRIMSVGIMVAVLASQASLPWLTREYQRNALWPAIERLSQPLFALAGFGAGLAAPWADSFLRLFGEEFVAAGPSLRWLLGATVVVYLGSSFLTAVIASGRGKSQLMIATIGLATNLVGNAWLVPIRGIEGAAIATFATESVVALTALGVLARAGIAEVLSPRGFLWTGGLLAFIAGWILSAFLPLAPVFDALTRATQ